MSASAAREARRRRRRGARDGVRLQDRPPLLRPHRLRRRGRRGSRPRHGSRPRQGAGTKSAPATRSGSPLSRVNRPSQSTGLAVGHVQVAPREHRPDRVVAAGVHDEVEVDRADLHELAARAPRPGRGRSRSSRSTGSTGTPPMSGRLGGRCDQPGRSVRCHSSARVPRRSRSRLRVSPSTSTGASGERPVRRRRRPSGPQAADDEQHHDRAVAASHGTSAQPGTAPMPYSTAAAADPATRADGEDAERRHERAPRPRRRATSGRARMARSSLRHARADHVERGRPPIESVACAPAAPPFAIGARRRASPANCGTDAGETQVG